MNFHPHISNTRIATRPGDETESAVVESLPITDVAIEGQNFMVSWWTPSVEELGLLLSGESVRLFVRGESHPVVAMDVTKSPKILKAC